MGWATGESGVSMRNGVSFRTKLILVVVPPLLVMAVLAVAVIRPQVDRSQQASDDQRRVRIAELAMQLSDEIELEQGLSARRISNETPELIGELSAQRRLTDEAAARFLAGATSLSTADPGVAEAFAAGEVVAGLRERLDSGSLNFEVTLREFAEQLAALDRLTSRLVFETTDAELLRRATAIIAQLDGKRELSAALNRVAGRLEASALIQRDFGEFRNDYEASLDAYDRFLSATDETGAATLASIREVAEVATIDLEAERIIDAGSAGDPYQVDPDGWWRLTTAALAAYDRLDDTEFERYLDLAADEAAAARRTTLVFALATLIGAVLAAAAAFLLGRSLSRRLQEVTDSAREIAVDRLPEVLEQLRNPTAEALAGAIPKVETRSTDEIGSLAESFNTVLRTSVETSIEHSTRRAETLTNLLVNLGRRNQALLERQLQLIDTLEAREQDPALLEGLFKLDHMVTRQRRNAESLLVLAGSRRSRSWSEPVPVSDVVRGAISEVADMGRVDFEMPPGHDLLVAGSHAVDLSHLLAELIENATSYSNPTTTVQLRVQRNGMHVRIWVIDSGVGMGDEELVAANQRVADPPDIDELTTDQVGFQVVGRLARRLDARVRLQTNPVGGLAAAVDLPPSAFEPLTGDLPIVAVAEAETRAAAGEAVSMVSDDQTLADLSAAGDDEPALPAFEVHGDGAALPQRRRGTTPIEPVADRAEPAPEPPVERTPLAQFFDRSRLADELDDLPPLEPAAAADEPRIVLAPAEPEPTLEVPIALPPNDPAVVAELPRRSRAASVPATPLFDRSAESDDPAPRRTPGATVAPAADGLARRTPGAALNTSPVAAEAELGLFRRLPTPRTSEPDDPADRLRVLRAFSRGVDEARSDDPAN